MRILFFCVDSCCGLSFVVWQEGRMARELALFFFNEKPSDRAVISISPFFPSNLSQSCSQQAQKQGASAL
jgi:hypothetical protein